MFVQTCAGGTRSGAHVLKNILAIKNGIDPLLNLLNFFQMYSGEINFNYSGTRVFKLLLLQLQCGRLLTCSA